MILQMNQCFNSFMTEALSYLLRKSMDLFLYDNGLRHERVNMKLEL